MAFHQNIRDKFEIYHIVKSAIETERDAKNDKFKRNCIFEYKTGLNLNTHQHNTCVARNPMQTEYRELIGYANKQLIRLLNICSSTQKFTSNMHACLNLVSQL